VTVLRFRADRRPRNVFACTQHRRSREPLLYFALGSVFAYGETLTLKFKLDLPSLLPAALRVRESSEWLQCGATGAANVEDLLTRLKSLEGVWARRGLGRIGSNPSDARFIAKPANWH
jgi:hypothetical protein